MTSVTKFLALTLGLLCLSGCTTTSALGGVALLDGGGTTLESQIAGKPAVINFWAAWCIFCKQELPFFAQAAQEHPEITFIGVNLKEPLSTVRSYWENGDYGFPTLLDPQGELARQFDVFTQPTTIFLNAAGEIVFKKNGPLTREELQKHVTDLDENAQLQSEGSTPSCGSGSQLCHSKDFGDPV